MNTRRQSHLRPDANGNFRPYVGWKISDDGKRRQHRFNLGSDQRTVEVRYAKIQKLYEDNCQENGENLWSVLALSYAEAIANGEPLAFDKHADTYEAIEYAQVIESHRQMFPSITGNIVPSDELAYRSSVAMNKELIASRLKELETELRSLNALVGNKELPDKLITGSFYEAVDSYKSMIERDGERLEDGVLKPSQRKRLEKAERFKEHHEDFPLYEMNFDKCKELNSYWRNRPLTKRGNRSSHHNARHHLNELVAFWKWLDTEDDFGWQIPKGVLTLPRKIVRLTEDRKTSVVSKPVYSPSELATINKYATERERLALYVGLNCAMGAAELGRLTIDDVLFNHKHEYAERLQFSSTEQDSFIRTYRPKTDVFGEWILWTETAELLRKAIENAQSKNSELIFIRETGSPLYNESNKNPSSAFNKLWYDLLDRTQKHEGEEFRRLPFGTLRDTLPDMLRHTHSDELASMSVAHGSPANGDSLLDCYGNRPYGRLHEAIRELYEKFSIVLNC